MYYMALPPTVFVATATEVKTQAMSKVIKKEKKKNK